MPNPYEPKSAPVVSSEDARAIVSWIYDELREIAARSQTQEDVVLQATNVAPAKPVVGEQRWADGTNWNPGGGAGMYEYTGGGVNGWRMLASGVQY